MSSPPSRYAAQVIRIYLECPDTPSSPSSADWLVAHNLEHQGLSLATIRLAIQVAILRRRERCSGNNLPPIRSLAYFRTVALNLTSDEKDPAYAEYVELRYHSVLGQSPAEPENRAP